LKLKIGYELEVVFGHFQFYFVSSFKSNVSVSLIYVYIYRRLLYWCL